MDGPRFDRLARGFAVARSRRSLARSAGIAALAAIGGRALSARPAEARCFPESWACPSYCDLGGDCAGCCSGYCGYDGACEYYGCVGGGLGCSCSSDSPYDNCDAGLVCCGDQLPPGWVGGSGTCQYSC